MSKQITPEEQKRNAERERKERNDSIIRGLREPGVSR